MDVSRVRARIRGTAKRALVTTSALFRDEVTRRDAVELLAPWAIAEDRPDAATMSASTQHGPVALYDEPHRFVPSHADLVHELPSGDLDGDLRLTRYGGLRVGRSLFDLDFGTASGVLEAPFGRTRHVAGLVVAPWSHRWGEGYFDWVVMVLGKLLRIEEALGTRRWASSRVALAHTGTGFARWYLDELGVGHRLLDPTTGPRLAPEVAVVGTNQPWMRPSVDDLLRLRDRFGPAADGLPGLGPLVWVQRSGRRRVRNEDDLLPVLARHGVEVMEDGRYSVPEQVAIFRDARVVVAPHGAGLTNLLHAPAGTTVLELFGPGYSQDCFRWMSTVLGMDHHVLATAGAARAVSGDAGTDHHTAVEEDFDVDPADLDAALTSILGSAAARRTA